MNSNVIDTNVVSYSKIKFANKLKICKCIYDHHYIDIFIKNLIQELQLN